jgi:hypothetical protein
MGHPIIDFWYCPNCKYRVTHLAYKSVKGDIWCPRCERLRFSAFYPIKAQEQPAVLPCPICNGIEGCDHTIPERQRAVFEDLSKRIEAPIDVVLFCPRCRFQHIDKAEPDVCQECGHAAYFHQGPQKVCLGHINAACNCQSFVAWLNPPHKSHRCSNCNAVWRPADAPTNGVERATTVGSNDTDSLS